MVTINIQTLRNANPGWTDIDALNSAMGNTSPGLQIYFPAGGGTHTDGAYDIWTDSWATFPTIPATGNITRGDVTIYGDGFNSVIRQPVGKDLVFMAHPPGGAATPVKSDITIRDLLIDGNLSRSSGYNEESHLVRIAGVTNFTALRVRFRDFMGEGLNLSSPKKTLVPKNKNLIVDTCIFEGIFAAINGRNAIAILDCEKYTITGCSFTDIGSNRVPSNQPGPGAIDIEPVQSAAVVTQGKIYNCSFTRLHRNAVALLNGVSATANDVEITYCNVDGAGFGLVDIQHHSNVRINNNYCDNLSQQGGTIAVIRNSTYVDITTNTFKKGFYIELSEAHHFNINNNGFQDCARGNGMLFLQTGNVSWGSILYNQLYTCGAPSPAENCIYFIRWDYISTYFVNIIWNTINGPTYLTRVGGVINTYLPLPVTNPLYDYVDPTANNPAGFSLGDFVKKP